MKGEIKQLCVKIIKEYYGKRACTKIKIMDITRKLKWEEDVYPTPQKSLNVLKGYLYNEEGNKYSIVEIYERDIKDKFPISPTFSYSPAVVAVNAKPFIIVPIMLDEFYLFLDRTIEGFTLIKCEFDF